MRAASASSDGPIRSETLARARGTSDSDASSTAGESMPTTEIAGPAHSREVRVPASDQCHTLEHTRVCPQCGFGEVKRVGCTGRQAVDGDVALVVVQSGQQPRQYRQGIGDRPP